MRFIHPTAVYCRIIIALRHACNAASLSHLSASGLRVVRVWRLLMPFIHLISSHCYDARCHTHRAGFFAARFAALFHAGHYTAITLLALSLLAPASILLPLFRSLFHALPTGTGPAGRAGQPGPGAAGVWRRGVWAWPGAWARHWPGTGLGPGHGLGPGIRAWGTGRTWAGPGAAFWALPAGHRPAPAAFLGPGGHRHRGTGRGRRSGRHSGPGRAPASAAFRHRAGRRAGSTGTGPGHRHRHAAGRDPHFIRLIRRDLLPSIHFAGLFYFWIFD